MKHQKRVRNCFKPTQCFLSLLFRLGLPLFPACRQERFGTHQRWGLDTIRFLHMPPGSGPGMGMQQARGAGLFGVCKGCSSLRLGGKKKSLMVQYYFSLPGMGTWKKDSAVAGGSDQGQNDQKRCLDAHWLPTGQHEHFHKVKFLYALALSLNTEGQRMRGS